MIRKTFIETESGLVARVTFILPNSTWADTIYLVGDFNGWNHTSRRTVVIARNAKITTSL
jgi:hypothetical protein